MIVVHHLNNSRSQRILWQLEELGLEYDIKRYQRDASTMLAPPELRAVHPLGKSPVIEEGELKLAESGAIVQYLAERYGAGTLMPREGTPERVRCLYWMHFAEGSAMPPLLLRLIFDRTAKAAPWFARPIAHAIARGVNESFIGPNLTRHLDYMEAEIAKTGWFAGSALTAADVQMSFPLEASAARGGLNESRPKLMDWLARIHARPAYKRALERGGEYGILR